MPSIVAEAPIIAIVRRPKVDPARCIERLFEAGIRLIEITKRARHDHEPCRCNEPEL